MSSKSDKILSCLIIFVIVFTYMGETLKAIATTDAITAITNGFFKSDEMSFNSYFEENNTEQISDVNSKPVLTLELSPTQIGQGFLKSGRIIADSTDESNISFKFSKIKNITVDETNIEPELQEESTNVEDETETNIEPETQEETADVEDETETNIEPELREETADVEDETETNIEPKMQEESTDVEDEEGQNIETELQGNTSIDESENDNILINEEKIIEVKTAEAEQESYEELISKNYEIEITDDNEISVQNIIYNTKIEVEIEFINQEKININDLYKEINLKLTGKYININLESIDVEVNNRLFIGWSYNTDFEVKGEYTQFSPFQLGTHEGIIVENKLQIIRQINDEKYLPIKQTTIEVEVPEYNGELPETVNVQSTKLMATRGEDAGNVIFNESNWNYNQENKKISIIVNNNNENIAQNSIGEDEYIIVYRYNSYSEIENANLENNFKVTIEQYSGNNNVKNTKDFSNSQEIKTELNNIISYNISTTEDKINKAKINANYNNQETRYETEFITTVNLNILTSDLLEELKVDSSKEKYLDENMIEIDADKDIYYNRVKFNYSEINSILQNGGTVEIQTATGELLYTLNNELIHSQDDCEIRLESKENGICVVFKNISSNGNISIEFTKAIGKSNFDKSKFNTFKSIRSYVSAELKYMNYDERYVLEEISTTKGMSNSTTVAEIVMLNNNLNTLSKNDNVEIRIVLNNDKQDTDLYTNPCFELVFPNYITNVEVENIGIIYESGLKIKNHEIYKDGNIVKMKIDLEGTQNEFCQSAITNGTNIILNLNITLNEYTPKKQDQIKMYYYNEGATSYKSQTKWTINKQLPNGILKETNGFDVAIINYQAPNGMVLSNGIANYDGQANKIKSINQGEKTVQIEHEKNAQIATMELAVMNNTSNTCTGMVLIGRIPNVGSKSVVTGKDIGTTVNVKVLSGINENIANPYMTTIYYSSNERASIDLKNEANMWSTEVADYSSIKSYMIIIKGEIKPGVLLKYSYDFEIPENVGYDAKIYGNFGAYYNNHYENVIAYESVEADKVGLYTTKAPVSQDTVPDEELPQEKPHESENEANDVEIIISQPTLDGINDRRLGDKYTYCTEITNKSSKDLTNVIVELNLDSKIEYEYSSVSRVNLNKIVQNEENYSLNVITSDDIEKIEKDRKITEDSSANYNSKSHVVSYAIETINKNEKIYIYTNVYGISEGESEVYATIKSKEEKDKSTEKIKATFYSSNITIEEVPGNHEQLMEQNKVNLVYKLKNNSDKYIEEFKISGNVSENISDFKMYAYGDVTGSGYWYADTEGNNYKTNLYYLYSGDECELHITGKIKPGTKGQNFSDLIEIYINDIRVAGHNYSYGITENPNPPMEEEESYTNENEIKYDTLEEQGEYVISGNIYVDKNGDDIKTEDDGKIESQVQVQLLKDATMIRATTTSSDGNYTFTGLKEGNYTIVYNYDSDKYTSNVYNGDKKLGSIIEVEEGMAVTDTITIENESIENLQTGLGEKERFDFDIKQYISKAVVDINGKETEYDYNDLNLAKLEINPDVINKSKVKIIYKIAVKNVGNVEGQVTSIVDYIPAGMSFVEAENENWSLGTIQGNVYYNGLANIEIKPGETKEVTLILNKAMTEDNTGILSNKAKIAYTESMTRLTEAVENNFASQETIVTLTQGASKKTKIIFTISMVIILTIFAFMIKTGKLEISLHLGKGIKKVYK